MKLKKDLIKDWLAFISIGGGLVMAILVTVAMACFGPVHPTHIYAHTHYLGADNPVTTYHSDAADPISKIVGIVALICAWISLIFPTIALFFNKKQLRDGMFAGTFLFHFFAFFLTLILTMMFMGAGLIALILAFVGFVITIITDSCWLGINNTKLKKRSPMQYQPHKSEEELKLEEQIRIKKLEKELSELKD